MSSLEEYLKYGKEEIQYNNISDSFSELQNTVNDTIKVFNKLESQLKRIKRKSQRGRWIHGNR